MIIKKIPIGKQILLDCLQKEKIIRTRSFPCYWKIVHPYFIDGMVENSTPEIVIVDLNDELRLSLVNLRENCA
jgi:hypothetical protein